MNDIDGWGRPENLGLRRDEGDPVTMARRGGIVALVLGLGMGSLGAMQWSGDLAFLEALGSAQGRLGAGLCVVSGALALLLSRAAWRDTLR